MSVFVDTSALYALLVSTEDGHTEVATAFRDLVGSGRRLVTTNYVLLEASALLQHRFGLDAVRDLETSVGPLMEVFWIDKTTHRKALQRLFGRDRRQLSLVDCSSFVSMDAQGIREVLALDRDFEREGYRILPST